MNEQDQQTHDRYIAPHIKALGPAEGPNLMLRAAAPPDEEIRNRIQVNNRQLRDVGQKSLEELRRYNRPPKIFNRGGNLVRIDYLSDKLGKRYVIAPQTIGSLRGLMSESADFYRKTWTGEPACSPPKELAEHIFAMPPEKWEFPSLLAIIENPTLRPSGTVLSEPGYDTETQLVYANNGLTMSAVNERPDGMEVERARCILEDVFYDFPFVDDNNASRANATGALITSVIRTSIEGSVPMALFDATQAGSGKSLLADVIALVTTGRPAAMRSYPDDEAEMRKQLTSGLMEGPSIWVYDNVDRLMASGELCKTITATCHTDRALQQSTNVHLPVRCTWIATGNNFRIGGDLPRRCYWIKLDPKCSRPEDRKGPHAGQSWRHPDLRKHIVENRGEILWAILTIARSWFALDCPISKSSPVLGGFEEWSTKLGGILECAGILGFLGNVLEMHAQADVESEQWEAFLKVLHELYPSDAFSVGEIARRITNGESKITDVLPDTMAAARDKGGSLQHRLGSWFRQKNERRFGDSQIHITKAAGKLRDGALLWRVVITSEQQDEADNV
jgi:hypothetical protein